LTGLFKSSSELCSKLFFGSRSSYLDSECLSKTITYSFVAIEEEHTSWPESEHSICPPEADWNDATRDSEPDRDSQKYDKKMSLAHAKSQDLSAK
jgi:hypothetical protein